MNTVSVVGSISRRAGGLFESVRRLHRELIARNPSARSTCESESGGSATSIGVSVQVLSLRDEFSEPDVKAWAPVSVRLFDCCGPRSFGYAPELLDELLGLEADLTHIHGLWQFTSTAVLNWHRKTRRPYLISPHGMLDEWALRHSHWRKQLAWFAYERAHLRAATCIRALCESEARSIRKLGLTNPICVIPNGVRLPVGPPPNPGTFAPQQHLDPCIDSLENREVLLFLGRIHPKKGLASLLQAWAKANPPEEWVLVIAGWEQGRHEGELKCLANDLGIRWSDGRSGHISTAPLIFAGPQFGADKERWLRRCDAFILPSLSEGVPMAILEAWSHAKPVLMSPQCNLPEGFANGAALCADPAPGRLASALRELFSLTTATRQQMGARGRHLVSCRFAWPRIADDLRAVYFWMTGGGSKPSCLWPN